MFGSLTIDGNGIGRRFWNRGKTSRVYWDTPSSRPPACALVIRWAGHAAFVTTTDMYMTTSRVVLAAIVFVLCEAGTCRTETSPRPQVPLSRLEHHLC